MYFYDPEIDGESEVDLRASGALATEQGKRIMLRLQDMIKSHNIFYAELKQNIDDMQQQPEMKLVISSNISARQDHTGAYNLPSSTSIAALVPAASNGQEGFGCRDIILNLKDGTVNRISNLHPSFDSLHYVLLFPYGDNGWHLSLKSIHISQKDFACHRLMFRTNESCSGCVHDKLTTEESDSKEAPEHYPTLMKSGRLLQQYVVENAARIEDQRLNWVQNNQAQCRIENYALVMDALREYDNDEKSHTIGTRIVLPSSHTGSPRDLQQRYQDAMAAVRVLGKPHLFLTMTCNPAWPEIKDVIREWNALAVDCPQLLLAFSS